MSLSKEYYFAAGRAAAMQGLSINTSGSPRAGWQLKAWNEGYYQAVETALKEVNAKPAAKPVSPLVRAFRDQQRRVYADAQRRCEATVRKIKHRLALRAL